jgi:uncharacterized Zn finger protein (UPF0148 family)
MELACPHCFKATVYKFDKPKFCSFCGKNYTTGFQVEQPKSLVGELRKLKPRRPAPRYQEDYDDNKDYEDETSEVSNISVERLKANLTVEGVAPQSKQKLKLVDVAMGAGGHTQGQQEKDAETALRDYRDSGKSARMNPTEIR